MSGDLHRDLSHVGRESLVVGDGVESCDLEVLKVGVVGTSASQLVAARPHEVYGQAAVGQVEGVSPRLAACHLCGDTQPQTDIQNTLI